MAGLGWLCGIAGVATFVGLVSCGTAPTAFLVSGPGQFGNDPPTLTILEPVSNLTRGQGSAFLIQWNDTDRDDNARIRFTMINTVSNAQIVLVDGVAENDEVGPDSHTVGTSLIPQGTYNLFGTITDGVTSVDVYATSGGATAQRVVISIVPEGGGPPTEPPQITITEPNVNLSMAQDDTLTIVVQPTAAAPNAAEPFDTDSDITVYVVLDTDLDPTNDDPANPVAGQLILLDQRTITQNQFETPAFEITIDLAEIPPRPAGEPYFIRATANDGTNEPVHRYAVATINIVQLASGTVDLADVGRTVSGARWYGFNPGANVGSKVTPLGDFDLDGADDFLFVAQFGNPQNVGPVGEAYLVYGHPAVQAEGGDTRRPGRRFGGDISVNSISHDLSGVVFHAPPVRTQQIPDFFARTEGITDVAFVPDLSGDGRPELFFGLPHVHGAWDSTDYDPGDEDIDEPDSPLFCYPDFLVNNFTNGGPRINDTGYFAGGMAVLVNSQNRDDEGIINVNRLERTSISLELSGQLPVVLDADGQSEAGAILPRANNSLTPTEQIGNDPQEDTRISGARFIAGGFDYIFQVESPREEFWGQDIGFLDDLTSDGLPELIISAPRNERFLNDLRNNLPEGFNYSPQLESTAFIGSITVFPGTNYNDLFWRELADEDGTCVNPALDQQHFSPFGACTGNPIIPRHLFWPAETFEIFAENIDDMLGDGQSAGDFNLDGLGDILCGAPGNDRTSSLRNSGATYIIYTRTIFGEILLSTANDPILRPPMLRIRGLSRGDQIGWRQSTGFDVNGDRIDDVFLASPHTDFGGVARATCAGDFNSDGNINQNDLRDVSFADCRLDFGDDVFSSDACKVYDYDNDGDIDDDDRCVFCCLSDECEPDGDCVYGTGTGCCDNLVDNGFVAVVFGGRFTDGDRTIAQISTSDLPGTIFYGGRALDRAGMDVSSAGDFNHDGFGDILIAAPGEIRRDSAGRQRVGVVYLVFGGTHLTNETWNLSDSERGVGSLALPGLVFLSPYVSGRPNEAAPVTVGSIGDINDDGFDDIFIGNPKADFIDLSFPQGPDAPGSDAAAGRRRNAGDAYIVYGNNFGPNRVSP
jgi:hypothetical protein